jgi:hypothetical protein
MAYQATLTGAAAERAEDRKGEQGEEEEQVESITAWVQIILLARQHRFTHK